MLNTGRAAVAAKVPGSRVVEAALAANPIRYTPQGTLESR